MSEQSKIDAERAAFEAWYAEYACVTADRVKTWRSGCGYREEYSGACTAWEVWQARASLPVGVPDGESIRRAAVAAAIEIWGDGEGEWTEEDERFYPAFVRILLNQAAAPTVKAEQPDEAKRIDKQCRDDVAAALGFVRGGNYAWSYLLTQIKECVRVAEAPSLPTAGSAGEEVEVVAHIAIDDPTPEEHGDWDIEPDAAKLNELARRGGGHIQLMTVAQHNRIVAALSAQQSAPERVSLPVELLERIAGKGCDPDCCIAYWREHLRALLASHGREV